MADEAGRSIEFGEFRIDAVQRRLLRRGDLVPLPPKAFDLLLALVRARPNLVSKAELMNSLWPDTAVEESNLTQNVFQLRKALGETAHDHTFIVTVPGQGYRFVADAHQPGRPAPAIAASSGRFTGPLAVLPFRVLGGSSADEYLGLALADAVITRLSGVNGILMRPTGSVLRYATSAADPVVAGRELDVDTVIHGVAHRAEGKLRITVQMASLSASAVVWADVIDQPFSGVFEAQDALCDRIAAALRIPFSDEEQRQLARHYTEDVDAYQAYLKGRHFWEKRTPDGFRKAIQWFERAAEHDPGYALAHAGLADSYTLMACYGLMPCGDAWSNARIAAERAVAIDDRLAEAHSALALVRMGFEWDWKAGERECRRSLDLNPRYATAYNYLAEWLTSQNRVADALIEIRRAQALEPLSLIINRDIGAHLYFARRYGDAIAYLRDTMDLARDFAQTHATMAWALERAGRPREAIEAIRTAIGLIGPTGHLLGEIGHAQAMAGDTEAARLTLNQMTELSRTDWVSPYHFAIVRLALGDLEGAMRLLEEAAAVRAWQMVYLLAEPKLDPLRATARFQSLVRSTGLPYSRSAGEARASTYVPPPAASR